MQRVFDRAQMVAPVTEEEGLRVLIQVGRLVNLL